jgi:hypothetical protein
VVPTRRSSVTHATGKGERVPPQDEQILPPSTSYTQDARQPQNLRSRSYNDNDHLRGGWPLFSHPWEQGPSKGAESSSTSTRSDGATDSQNSYRGPPCLWPPKGVEVCSARRCVPEIWSTRRTLQPARRSSVSHAPAERRAGPSATVSRSLRHRLLTHKTLAKPKTCGSVLRRQRPPAGGRVDRCPSVCLEQGSRTSRVEALLRQSLERDGATDPQIPYRGSPADPQEPFPSPAPGWLDQRARARHRKPLTSRQFRVVRYGPEWESQNAHLWSAANPVSTSGVGGTSDWYLSVAAV